jgi:translocation and assembly module TamB
MEAEEPPPPPPERRWLRRLGWGVLALVLLAVLAVVVLDSSIGHRFVADRIAAMSPKSGLKVSVGRIDGSLFGKARIDDLTLSDPQGTFATVPEVQLDWRPLRWFSTGVDIRELVLRRGTLLRLPKLRPGDPDQPILPNFDIRIDRLQVERLTVAQGVLGAARRVDLIAQADIRKGRALIKADGNLGGSDRLAVLLDAEPDRDKFDLKLDVQAPRGGLLAGLAAMPGGLALKLGGKGSWRNWNGALLAEQDGKRLAALQLTNRVGRYGVLGLTWPEGLLSGLAGRAAGAEVAIAANGTLEDSVLRGTADLTGAALALRGAGAVDLARNRFDGLKLDASPRDPERLLPGVRLEATKLAATLDGPFRDLSAQYRLTVGQLISGTTRIESLTSSGNARFDGKAWKLPIDASAARVVTGDPTLDSRLVTVTAKGTLALSGAQIASDDLALSVPGIAAKLALRGDMARGSYGLAGPIAASGLALSNLGTADAAGRIVARFGAAPWLVNADLTGRMVRVDNATLTTIAGSDIRFGGKLSIGRAQPLLVESATLNGSQLSLALSGRMVPGSGAQLSGSGRHVQYGPFSVSGTVASEGPRLSATFANPMPGLGLKDVKLALAPIAGGFHIDTSGGSKLGSFTGKLGLFAPPGKPTRIAVERFDVWRTSVTGALALQNGLASGRLTFVGGGVDGTLDLTPQSGGQGFIAALTANDARFGGDIPLTIGTAKLNAQGLLRKGYNTVTGSMTGAGIGQGQFFLGRVAASARLTDGQGQVTASLAGRRGSRFDLQLLADVAPQRVAVAAQGQFAGQRIVMPRRAVLTRADDGWALAPTQIDFAGGRMIASGRLGAQANELKLALANMQLSAADIIASDLGLGGRISGLVDYRQAPRGVPTGEFKLKIAGLTRSGLVLTSRPIDMALVGSLLSDRLEARAIASEGGQVRGRLQARISGLGGQGALIDRISSAPLFGQLRYDGPADALWRLAALESFDLTGPLTVAADVTGSLAAPSIRGSLAGNGLALQSALTGTQVSDMTARGSFAGSQLVLSSLSGQTAGGGTISGSGSFDFSGIGQRGPTIDLRLAARAARVLARDDMAATVTGPLLIRSDGTGGVVAGRLTIDRAAWQLGRAATAEQLPIIRTREINRAVDGPALRTGAAPWRLMIDARGAGRVDVRGMGLDSEWSADIELRGTTANTAISGQAAMVRGTYEFAGKRFEMTRGRIVFDGRSPPDPRLDILAEDRESGLTARIAVTGTSLRPEVAFSSIPALPEDELLSRMLFGASITKISAPEALQLGAALASLRSGGGLDPINRLRRAIGLDRLRIVSADVAAGRGTGLAAGKFITRRLYAEVVTDGRGYSATQLEFRVTNWLSLLSAISTVGRESINAKISKDY